MFFFPTFPPAPFPEAQDAHPQPQQQQQQNQQHRPQQQQAPRSARTHHHHPYQHAPPAAAPTSHARTDSSSSSSFGPPPPSSQNLASELNLFDNQYSEQARGFPLPIPPLNNHQSYYSPPTPTLPSYSHQHSQHQADQLVVSSSSWFHPTQLPSAPFSQHARPQLFGGNPSFNHASSVFPHQAQGQTSLLAIDPNAQPQPLRPEQTRDRSPSTSSLSPSSASESPVMGRGEGRILRGGGGGMGAWEGSGAMGWGGGEGGSTGGQVEGSVGAENGGTGAGTSARATSGPSERNPHRSRLASEQRRRRELQDSFERLRGMLSPDQVDQPDTKKILIDKGEPQIRSPIRRERETPRELTGRLDARLCLILLVAACNTMLHLQDANAQLKERLAFYESFSGPAGPFPTREMVDFGLQQRSTAPLTPQSPSLFPSSSSSSAAADSASNGLGMCDGNARSTTGRF